MTGTQREKSARTVSHLAAQVRGGDDSWLRSVDKDWQHLKTATDEDGRTLLHTIAAVGRIDLLQHVEEQGFMVGLNRADAEGWTPLLSAASAGHEGAVQFLLKAGADVNARTKGGRSALHYVASKGHARVAKVLIEAGADVRAADVHKSTPLHRACSTCKEVMVDLLIDAGASLAAADENGDTAMHVAVEFATDRPSAQAAFQLAAKGAALQAKNKAGQTPISLAGENADALQAAAASFARDKLG